MLKTLNISKKLILSVAFCATLAGHADNVDRDVIKTALTVMVLHYIKKLLKLLELTKKVSI